MKINSKAQGENVMAEREICMCFYPSVGVFIQSCTGQIFLSVYHMPRTYWVLGTADGELIRQTEILALMELTF